MALLTNGLGGSAGFGENFLARNDDGSTTFINLQAVFGQGLNFFGTVYDGLYLNNNGSVTFGNATGSYTPTSISGNTNNPMIAAFWADVDTRGPAGGVTPGGNSTGTNLLWYDLDSVNHIFTATWDDVGYYSGQVNKLNAFQIRLIEVAGGFDIELRYEDMNWTTGGASGGSNGLGGTPARAGYTSGNGFNFFELPQSGNQNALLDLETATNVGDPGVFRFSVRGGAATVALSPTDVTVNEGNGTPVRYAVVTVNLAAPSANPVTVNYATANGTAIAGSDYVSQRGTLTFAPGVLQQNIFVEIIGDTTPEAAETFRVVLSGATGAQIADAEAIVTIANDDGLAISDVRMLEGTGVAATPFVFTVTLLSAAAAPVTVNYNVTPGSAVVGSDYAATNGTLTFAAGETTKTVTVNVTADSASEADETFNVVLSGASGAPISDATGVGTILNDDGLVVDDVRVVEGTAATTVNVPVTVRLLSPATGNVTFDWTTVPGTATAPADFTSVSGNATILAGATSVVLQVPVVRDSLVEPSHSFEVVISNAVGTAIVDARGTVTIADDDGFVVSDLTLNEGSSATGTTSANFVVTLQSPLATTATVNYATVNGTATAAGHDYVHQAGTLTFNPGETTKTVTVLVGPDFNPESNETFSLVLSNPSVNAGITDGTGQALIVNDDGLSVGNASITEGNAGTANVSVTITLSAAAAAPVSVNWTTANGTAVAVSDYVAQSGTVTFAAGETSKTVQVAVVGDTNWEPTESFQVVLSNPTGSSIVDGSGTVTVFDNDVRPPPALSVTNASITEGTGAGTTIMRFVVGLSYAATSPVTVAYATTNGTATAGSDYTTTNGILTIPTGSLFGIVEVPVTRDALVEGNETLTLTLSSPTGGVTIDDGTAVGTIVNDDARLSIAATSASKAEGQSGSTAFTFTVTRTGDTGTAHTAAWAVTGTGATPANAADFTGGVLPSGTVSFAAGETSKVITVNVAGDTLVEANDGFTVTLSSPSAGAVLGTPSAAGSIVNDDTSTTLSIAPSTSTKAEGQSGSTAFTFTVTRTGNTGVAHSAAWAVTGTGASPANAADFTGGVLPSGTVNFLAGETSKVITVNVAGDTLIEANDGFTVTLSNPSAGAALGTASAAGSILNDDASLSIAATSASKAEGQSGSTPFTFTVTRTGDTGGADSAAWAVTGTGAAPANAADFTGGVLPSGTVSFLAGETSKVVTVSVAGDSLVEGNDGFTVTLSNPSIGAVLGTASAAGSIVNDDASLSIAATSASKAEGQSGSTAFTFTVTRTGDTSGADSAAWGVTGRGATPANAADFTGGVLPGGTVSFLAGQTSKVITVNVAGDGLVEGNDGFTVTLSNPSIGAVLGTASAAGSIVNDDPVDDYAGNNTTTGLVAAGGTATGNLETAGDADWFRVFMTADTTYTVRLDGATVAAGTLADPFVYLHNSAGTQLASNNDSGGAANPLLVFTPTVTGTYYVSARDFGDNSTGTYRVGVTASADGPFEAAGEVNGNEVVDPATQASFQEFFNSIPWHDFLGGL